MAHKKGAGSTNNGRDSISKRLGVKIFGGQIALAGNIIVRQRGTKFHPGQGVGLGKDHTIYALTDGNVVFTRKRNNRTYISVLPIGADMPELKPKPVAKKKKEAPKVEAPVAEEVVEAAAPVVEEEAPVLEAAAPVVEEPKAEEVAPKKKKAAKGDDLKKIEGIGPKIAETLNAAGLETYQNVADSTPEKLADLITDVRGNHVTDTWPAQAQLAADGKWDELQKWQDELDGGKPVEAAEADDLTKIEGVGPKIAETLTAAGLATYSAVAKSTPEKLSEIITDVRGNHVTDTWPKQAELAADGKWEELQKWQDELDGGKPVEAAEADDLTKIEGVGPKIAETLTAAGLSTYAAVAKSTPEKLSEIITDVRGNHVTDTWPKQAELAADGKWEELQKWQDELDGGKA